MQARFGIVLMVTGAVVLALSLSLRHALPSPAELLPDLRDEPAQIPTQAAPFGTTVGGITYTVKPVADYEIRGLVVSSHDSSAWWDWIHKAANDRLNVVDLCVVFAENVASGAYVGLDFSSGQFVCYAHARSEESWRRFSMRALSNNHLLADRPSIVAKLRDVRIGDQVRIRGWLAEYGHNHGFAFRRGTSLTRDDTGNGACETIYVQEVEVLRAGGGAWRWLPWPALGLVLAGIVVWLRAPLRAR
ncbi:MAG: hypothetical protein ACM3PU_04335 [Gemmatimonadota bacterium]